MQNQWCSGASVKRRPFSPMVAATTGGSQSRRYTRQEETPAVVMFANDAINARFQMSNDFPIFMALVDLALFAPELIRPDSPVPPASAQRRTLICYKNNAGDFWCVTHDLTEGTGLRGENSRRGFTGNTAL